MRSQSLAIMYTAFPISVMYPPAAQSREWQEDKN